MARRASWAVGVTKLAAVGALAGAGGCSTLGYYAQAIGGQFELARSSQPVQSVLADSETPESLRERLVLARRLVEFSRSELGFAAGDSYRRYVSLERPFVVWNLFAAPALSLVGRRWCYPVVGCVPYRGYFDEQAARRAAARLAGAGYETHVAGVPAYSSLGWFDDPLLSTFIDWPEPRFVELLVHELAHRRVWVAGDAAFNESFAEFAGEEGARRWYAHNGRKAEHDAYRSAGDDWRRLRALLLETRSHLDALYRSDASDAQRQQEKVRVLDAFRRCYRDHRSQFGGGSFDRVVQQVNNAYLFALASYADYGPAMAALSEQSGRWTDFLHRIDALRDLDAEPRRQALEALISSHGGLDDGVDRNRCASRPDRSRGSAGFAETFRAGMRPTMREWGRSRG